MRIAIVDDLDAERAQLKERLMRQLRARGTEAELLEFDSGEAFLAAEEAQRFTAAFLDIYAERLLLVEVENAFDGEVNEKSGLFRSSKRKENGIGIQSVQHIAEKTGGASTFTHQNGVFSAKVMLCGEKQPPETADSTTEL